MALQVPDLLDTKTYPFQRVRAMLADTPGLQPGVVAPGDLKVTQRAASANMSVDVAAGSSWVAGSRVARQGLYHIVDVGGSTVLLAAAHATLPRVDQVVARVEDSLAGDQADQATWYVAAGTPTAGATLDNRLGAAASPATQSPPLSVLRVADVLVPAAATTIVAANIRDRRPWAGGAFTTIQRLDPSGGYTVTAGRQLDAVNLQPRIECSGAPLRVKINGTTYNNGAAGTNMYMSPTSDGGVMPGSERVYGQPSAGYRLTYAIDFTYIPAPGSHLIGWQVGMDSGSTIFDAYQQRQILMSVEELVRPNAANG